MHELTGSICMKGIPGKGQRRQRSRPVARLEPSAAASPARWPIAVVLCLFAVVWVALARYSVSEKSATWDEPIHLTSGYAALTSRDYRLNPSHPPLVRMWAALPMAFGAHPRLDTSAIDQTQGTAWLSSPGGFDISREFLYADSNADHALNRARTMIMLLSVGLGVAIFFWTHEWLGFRAGVSVLAFYTLSPNMLAHGSLVTTDMGEAAFLFSSVYFLWRLTRRVGAGSVVGLVLSVAGATLTRYSGLALVPIVAVLLAIAAWKRTAVTPRLALRLSGLLAVTTVVAIWAVYAFRYAPSAAPGWLFHLQDSPMALRHAPVTARLVGWVDTLRLLPNAFSQGLLYCAASSSQPAYLLGDYSNSGWWYYFPVAFLVKTPVSLLVLLAAGAVAEVYRRRDLGAVNGLFVAVPAAIFAIFAMASQVNIGIRHILPVYPFVFLVAAVAADWWIASGSWVGRVAFASVMLVWLQGFAETYPHTLTYFNRAVGGPENGLDYLADSNLDWGQHLKALKQWMDDTGVSHVNLAYFGQAIRPTTRSTARTCRARRG